jgi:hypothetical protein
MQVQADLGNGKGPDLRKIVHGREEHTSTANEFRLYPEDPARMGKSKAARL